METLTLREQILDSESENWPAWKREFYQQLRANGESVVMANMLACRQGPQMHGNNDQQFGKASHRKMEDMPPWKRNEWIRIAKQNGIDARGKFKIPGLPPSHPDAWCTTVEDAATIYKKHNLQAEGVVNNTARPVDPPKRIALADNIANQIMQEKMAADPALAEKVKKTPKAALELKEQVISEHGRQ